MPLLLAHAYDCPMRNVAVLVVVSLVLVACAPTPEPPASGTPISTLPPTPTATAGGAPATSAPTLSPAPPPEYPLRGVSLSPKSYEAEDFTAFFETAVQAGPLIRWAGDWGAPGQESTAPLVLATLDDQYGFMPVVDTGVFGAGTKELFRPLTQEHQDALVASIAAFTAVHHVPYFGFGVEVNTHFEHDPGSFDVFVALFDRVYDAVKAVSPQTAVYVTFNLERIRGLKGGLFGGVNDESQNEWHLIDRFPKSDLIGFTSYPGLIYRDPVEVPAGYYDVILEHTGKPVAFTEVGWTHGAVAPGWEGDEAEQAAWVERLFTMIESLDTRMLIWLWLHKQPGTPDTERAFVDMGLFSDDGEPLAAWDLWKRGPAP